MIKKNWVTFFNGKAPATTKIALVQDGQKFATEIKLEGGGKTPAACSSAS